MYQNNTTLVFIHYRYIVESVTEERGLHVEFRSEVLSVQ